MFQRSGPGHRAVSALLAAVMMAAYLPFAAVAPAVAAPAPTTRSVFADLEHSGPVGFRSIRPARSERLNVRWRPGVPKTQLDSAARTLGFKVVRSSRLGWVQLEPAQRMTAGTLSASLRRAGLTVDARAAVMYKPAVQPATAPNDPLFPQQYGLNNTGQTGGTPDADIDAAEAWVRETGSKNVVVAVVDEGVNISHPDLKRNIWLNTDEIPGNDIDDDKNGYVDDVRGFDFYGYDNTVYDIADGDRHGTHVAGIIGAQGDNALGVAGVNWNVSIMPVKFLGPGGGDDFAAAEAMVYAVDNGADIINCSWGGYGESLITDAAIEYARKAGVLIVAAAGNESSNGDSMPFLPAASESPNVISVAATDKNDALADFSNFGVRTVDLAAPGADVTSTLPAEPNGIFVDHIDATTAYKLMYLPLQVEVIEPAAAREALIDRSMKRLGASASTPILVVDDSAAKLTGETQGPRLDTYLRTLSSAGFTNVASWVTDVNGSPSPTAMDGKVVVWFTGKSSFGWYGEYTLSAQDQVAIATYLDNGGRLFMASGEMATDLSYFGGQDGPMEVIQNPPADSGAPFLEKYFRVALTDLTTWSNTFYGKDGTQFAEVTGSLPAVFAGSEEDTSKLWPTGSDAVVPLYDIPELPAGNMPGEGGYPTPTDSPTPTPAPTRESVSTQIVVGKYGALSGTSMASPMVAGAAALLMAEFPSAAPEEIQARILNTTDAKPGLAGKTVFGGRLNLLSAMAEYPGRPTITAPSPAKTLLGGSETALTWAPARGGDPAATFEAQIGLPYVDWSRGFEDGTLGGFSAVETFTPWAVSSDTTDAYSGTRGAISQPIAAGIALGDGWVQGSTSAMTTTITVPAGGGTLSFWWKGKVGFEQSADFYIDGGADGDGMWEDTDWTQRTFELSEGEHNLLFAYSNFGTAGTTPDQRLSVDDITLTAHTFTSLGTAPAGATSLRFTVPSVDVDDAWLRVRADNGTPSTWAYSRGHRVSTDGVAPAAPAGLLGTVAGDGVVDLAWTNPADADFSATRVLWRKGTMPSGAYDASATVALEGTATAASISGLAHGERIYAAAFAMDDSGNVSEPATAFVTAVDVTAPQPVSFLEARMFTGAVAVNWMPPSPDSYDKITLLRRTDVAPAAGDAKAVTVFSGRGSVASDWGLPRTASDAYYTAYATDASGNRSTLTSLRFAPDLVAPDGEMVVNDGDRFTRDPKVTVASDITGASEMRIFPNGDFDPEAPWVPFAQGSGVELLHIDGEQTVVGEYRDAAGNYYSTSAAIYVDLVAPAAPTLVTAENWNAGVRLHWAAPSDESVVAYRVWKASSASGPWKLVTPTNGAEVSDDSFYVGGLTYKSTCFFRIAAVDGVGRVSPQSTTVSRKVGTGVVRRAGKTRYDTAAIVSARHFKTADTAVLVSGMAPADALGAAPLAGVVGGPVLLTGKARLDPFAAAEIARLRARNVIIVGGTGSVSNAVVKDLKARGLSVTRIAGTDRYEVAANVAVSVIERLNARPSVLDGTGTGLAALSSLFGLAEAPGAPGPTGWDGRVIVANGMAIADALAVAPFAYQSHTPVILVRRTDVPRATRAFLGEVGSIDRALVVGGAYTLPEAVAVQVSPEWRRLGGKTRYDIAVSVAEYAVDQGLLSWKRVGLASGTAFADGLAAGPAMGSAQGVVLLTPASGLHPSTLAALAKHAEEIGMVELFGGAGSIGTNVSAQAREAIRYP